MVKRTRLAKGSFSMKDGRLRKTVVSDLKNLPTERVKKYATLASGVTADSPVLSLTKFEAQKELARREADLSAWKHGRAAGVKSFGEKFKEGARTFAKYSGKVVKAYADVLSGRAAAEFEEGIATMGMKGKEKQKVLSQLRKERADADVDSSYNPFNEESGVPDFRVANVVAEGHRELQRARKEAY